MIIKNKKILIISPSKWGDMYISKHHYSIELAKLGNEVIYLEPAIIGKFGDIIFSNHRKDIDNLKIATPKMPKWMEILRFKYRNAYDFFCNYYIEKLLMNLAIDFDIVWCFETNLYSNLSCFKAKFAIFHPVDLLVYDYQRRISNSANIIFTPSQSIIQQLVGFNSNIHFINHGLNEDCQLEAIESISDNRAFLSSTSIRVGFVGNLFRAELNRLFISQIVKEFSKIEFHIWGPIEHSNSNVDGLLDNQTLDFVDFLKTSNNVKLHGVKRGDELVKSLKICKILILPLNQSIMYDGSNSHKIMEYLSIGNAIVSHHVTTYSDLNLLQMADDYSTEGLLRTFNETLNNLDSINSVENRLRRMRFALDNTYLKQIERIEEKINQLQFSEK
jgi:hypothetical protein